MKFNLKNDNYSDFGIYKKNVLFPRSYFISFSTPEEMAKTDIRTQRYNSSAVDVLSGEWDFVYYEKESLLPLEFDTDSVNFDKVRKRINYTKVMHRYEHFRFVMLAVFVLYLAMFVCYMII